MPIEVKLKPRVVRNEPVYVGSRRGVSIAATEHRGVGYAPQEAIDRKTALLMMTRWGAEYIDRERELGTLEPGKIADIIPETQPQKTGQN